MYGRQLAFPNPSIYRGLDFYPNVGDVVTRKTEEIDALEHFAMVYDIDWLGRIWVIECTKDIGVRVIPFEEFNVKSTFKHNRVDDRHRVEISQRMLWACQNREKFQWSIFFNCEDFVNWLMTGQAKSVQRNEILLLTSLAVIGFTGLKRL